MKMQFKVILVSATLFLVMGSVNTEVDESCMEDGCPCCEENMCNDLGRCTIACKVGYYGNRCYNKCPSYCTICGREFGYQPAHAYQKCYKCADGFYNGTGITNCSTPCPETCNKLLCDATNGSCLNGCINENIYGNKCDKCIKGKFGTNCSLACSANCNGTVCSMTEGKCTYGCVSNVFRGDKCNTCVVGKYGSDCDTPCPNNCENNLCFKSNGTCTKGCKGNFAGDVCNRCKDGFFGNECTKPCPNSCLHGICNFTSGYCTECATGWFGSNCERKCGKCKNETCLQFSSQCLYGCIGGYSGYNCINEMEEKSTVTAIAAVVGSVSAVVVIVAMVIIGLCFLRRRKLQTSRYQEQGQAYENTLVDIGLHDYQQLNTNDAAMEHIYDIPNVKPVENDYVNAATMKRDIHV